MRAIFLFASFAITCLAGAAAPVRAADEAVPPPPAANAASEVAPTPAPTSTPQKGATPPVAPKEAAKPKEAPKDVAPPASVTIISAREAHGVLGRDVRSAANEDMGKIVVDWNALRFGRVADKSDSVSLELTKDQVKAAPEYKEDMPIVVLGASGSLQPLQFDDQ